MSSVFLRNDFRFVLPSVSVKPIGTQGEIATSIVYYTGDDLTPAKLKREVARVPHMAELAKYLDPDRRIYLLDGDDAESLRLAAEYILNYHRMTDVSVRGEAPMESDDRDQEDRKADDWRVGDPNLRRFDFSAAVPLVDENDVTEFYSGDSIGFGRRGSLFEGNRNVDSRPWWTLSMSAPIVIECVGYIFGLSKMIQRMDERSLIILLHRNMDEGFGFCVEDDEGEPKRQFTHMDDVSFDLETELIRVPEAETVSDYKKQILRQSARQRFVPFAPSTQLGRILSQVKESRGSTDNQTLIKAISNAVLRRHHTGPLTNKDFDYLGEVYNTRQETKGEGETLIGQEEVKRQLKAVVDMMVLDRRRKEMGLRTDPISYTFAFLGAPGTGKTTWAKRLAAEMKEKKLLENTETICINAAELKAKYVGQTTGRVKALFDQYGVIILDEAYSLTEDEWSDDYTKEALAQLCVEIENHANDRLVVFAGYGGKSAPEDDRMLRFLQSNPGLSSRISFKISFENFRADELVRVFHAMMDHGGYNVPRAVDGDVEKYFIARMTERAFGNCREARNLCDRVKVRMAARLSEVTDLTREAANAVTREDVTGAMAEILEEYSQMRRNSAGKFIGFC